MTVLVPEAVPHIVKYRSIDTGFRKDTATNDQDVYLLKQ